MNKDYLFVRYEPFGVHESKIIGHIGNPVFRVKLCKATLGYITFVDTSKFIYPYNRTHNIPIPVFGDEGPINRIKPNRYFIFQRKRDIPRFWRMHHFNYKVVTKDVWRVVSEINLTESDTVTELMEVITKQIYNALGVKHDD